MYVIKRSGRKDRFKFDKITARLDKFVYGLDSGIDPVAVTQKVIAGLLKKQKQGEVFHISTEQLDEYAAETAHYMCLDNPDYNYLAGRIVLSNLQKIAPKSFARAMECMHQQTLKPVDPEEYDDAKGQMHPAFMAVVRKYKNEIDETIKPHRDFLFDDYASAMIVARNYSTRVEERNVETIQFFLMRVAIGIHCVYAANENEGANDSEAGIGGLQDAFRAYDLMSSGYFTNATPTLYHAGRKRSQLSSCYLFQIKDDSIEGIYDTLRIVAKASQGAGGIGLSVTKIRCAGSKIRSTGQPSDGLVPMLRVYNETARYVDQSGRRNGAFAVYLEPWHPDLLDFLELRKNHGKEERRCRDLFLALWIPDLFMKRVEEDREWSFFDPDQCPGLDKTYGKEFEDLYHKYESEQPSKVFKTMRAQDVMNKIIAAQVETGNPYTLYKDACNGKSNQKNNGTICCSNLCSEIIEYTSPDEVAVCNLASLGLPRFLDVKTRQFDYEKLHEVAYFVAMTLDRVIDVNWYPFIEAERSNKRHRPVGMGVQGLADVFMMLEIPFTCPEARELNRKIFATIYHAALRASCDVAKEKGAYETFPGSPASEGIFQFDMWAETGDPMWDWEQLRNDMKQYGLRNSLLVAVMPTCSTSALLGNVESIEPVSYNLYLKRTSAGEFIRLNKHLYRSLRSRDLWKKDISEHLLLHNGSVQNLPGIPDDLKQVFKTVWEISPKDLIDMTADRGIYIDQSQSFNIHIRDPTLFKVSRVLFYGWKKGLKTGSYYLRTEAKQDAIKFTVDPEKIAESQKRDRKDDDEEDEEAETAATTRKFDKRFCTRDDPSCKMCEG